MSVADSIDDLAKRDGSSVGASLRPGNMGDWFNQPITNESGEVIEPKWLKEVFGGCSIDELRKTIELNASKEKETPSCQNLTESVANVHVDQENIDKIFEEHSITNLLLAIRK